MLYQPREAFLPFHNRTKRWSCLVVHRRGGKTVACINDAITRALASKKKNAQYGYFAPYFVQAKQIAWGYLLEYGAEVITKKNEAELWVEVPNRGGSKSRIYLFGADNPDRMRGLYLDGAILDEPADMRPSFFGTIIRPMLADRKGWAVWIGTPKGHNEFYQIYKRAKSDPDWFHMHLPASQSGLIDADELIDARKVMTEDQYEQELECSFEAAIHGAVYGKWVANAEKAGRAKEGLFDKRLPVQTSFDMGFHDATAIWFYQIAHNEVRLIDYYEDSGHDIEHYCDVLKEKAAEHGYIYGKHYVPHDANYELQAAGGRSIVQQAFAHGVKMFVIGAVTQKDQIAAGRKTLEHTWFDPVKCDVGIEALKQYQFKYDEEKKEFSKVPSHTWASHASDAFEILSVAWQPHKPKSMESQPKFLHDLKARDIFATVTKKARHVDRI